MKFMLTYTIKPEGRNAAIDRFLATGGAPPKGVELLGRWNRADTAGGFALLDSGDPKALAEFALAWSDIIEIALHPVLEDPDLGEVLQRVKRG